MAEALTLEEIAEINAIKKIEETLVKRKVNFAQVAKDAGVDVKSVAVRRPFLERAMVHLAPNQRGNYLKEVYRPGKSLTNIERDTVKWRAKNNIKKPSAYKNELNILKAQDKEYKQRKRPTTYSKESDYRNDSTYGVPRERTVMKPKKVPQQRYPQEDTTTKQPTVKRVTQSRDRTVRPPTIFDAIKETKDVGNPNAEELELAQLLSDVVPDEEIPVAPPRTAFVDISNPQPVEVVPNNNTPLNRVMVNEYGTPTLHETLPNTGGGILDGPNVNQPSVLVMDLTNPSVSSEIPTVGTNIKPVDRSSVPTSHRGQYRVKTSRGKSMSLSEINKTKRQSGREQEELRKLNKSRTHYEVPKSLYPISNKAVFDNPTQESIPIDPQAASEQVPVTLPVSEPMARKPANPFYIDTSDEHRQSSSNSQPVPNVTTVNVTPPHNEPMETSLQVSSPTTRDFSQQISMQEEPTTITANEPSPQVSRSTARDFSQQFSTQNLAPENMEEEPTIGDANEYDGNMWGQFKNMLPYGAAVFGVGLGALGFHDFANNDYGDDDDNRQLLKSL